MNGTLDHIIEKFNINPAKESPFHIKCSRWVDLPKLMNELNFKTGVEVGVFRGQFSEVLCKSMPQLHLYGIDAWSNYDSYKDYGDDTIIKAEQETLERIKGLNCTMIKARSMDAVKNFTDESLDFVFIDGNHAYEYVVEDIAAWSKKVRKGGLVIGHDFTVCGKVSRPIHVIHAVTGWCNAYKIHPWFVLRGDGIKSWMYVKK